MQQSICASFAISKRNHVFRRWNSGVLHFLLGLCLCLFLGLAGCSREQDPVAPQPDFSVYLQDVQGVVHGTAVQWRGIEVGRVESVSMDQGHVRVDVRLDETYRGQFREGLRARPTRGFMGRGPAILEMYGGDDPGQPLLKSGKIIPEATIVDRITPGQMKAVGILVAAIILFLVVLRIMRRMVAFSLALALLVFAGWFMHRQWLEHGDELLSVRQEMQWNDMARSLLTEEAAQEAWLTVQTDLADALREAGGMGRDRLNAVTSDMRAALEEKAADLYEQGKDHAAEEVQRLRDSITSQGETPHR